jgi:hypothetical protein
MSPDSCAAEGDSQDKLLAAVRALTADVAALRRAAREPLTDSLAQYVAAHYARAVREAVRTAGEQGVELETLQGLCRDVVDLQRGDHCARRLVLDGQRLELDRKRAKQHTMKEFWAWTKQPAIHSKLWPPNKNRGIKASTYKRIERELHLM